MRFWERLFGKKENNPCKNTQIPMVDVKAEMQDAVAQEEETKTPSAPWTGDLLLKMIDNGRKAQYYGNTYSTYKVLWVSREKSSDGGPYFVRNPEEETTEYPKTTGFSAAGKKYLSLRQLTAETEERNNWCRDCYGREVFCVKERFPCFDSYDYLHENRYYRWFFLRENGKLTRVHYADGQNSIYVTEDVLYLETNCWDEMKKLDWFSEQGI